MSPKQACLRNVPCAACPYRKDAPKGLWHESEYKKLLEYDQFPGPMAVFMCHDGAGENAEDVTEICRGWYEAHGRMDNLAMRLHVIKGCVDMASVEDSYDNPCQIECFESGKEAHDHGIAPALTPEAEKMAGKLLKKHPRLVKGDDYDGEDEA